MPLTRFQIRNEYGLADPELYRAADKDDPEALLEGVAMAGLVGVLRQLGDLAEFAAEVFHDLHEEVITTAARGHGLMVRVQQLEAEVPSIEKAFLSQTRHTSFFTSAGIDWHPNLQSEQGLITRGDLPRFVMDSYEECRGPPRLFLLDKFDVAGAGACLKRYTDPSVFKVESKPPERSTIELQREKKIRKVKKKGPRWRNGGTPETGPTSHGKLHQLFLEDRVENCFNDPSRLVKLKKRQLNGCGNDPQNGKSYMGKFLKTPSPEHKMVCETSVTAPTLDLISDNTNELGLKILDITMVSPVGKSPGRVSTCSSCIAEEEVLKRPMNGEEIIKMPESTVGNEIETTPNLNVMMVENQLDHDGEEKPESSIDGYRSDGVISEVDNYMDALATMESEVETDNELRSKNVNLTQVGKLGSESDVNAEHLETQAQLSDSQSCTTNSSGSYGGIIVCKKYRSSSSCSDTVSSLVDNIQYDSEGATELLPSFPKACMVNSKNIPCKPMDGTPHSYGSKADEIGVLDDASDNEYKIPKSKRAYGDSCFSDSISPQSPLDHRSGPSSSLLVEPKLDETPPANLVNFGSHVSHTKTELDYYTVATSDVHDTDQPNTSERHSIIEREGGDNNVTPEDLLHPSNVWGLVIEKEAVEKVEDELQRECEDYKTFYKQTLPEIEACTSALSPSETIRASTDDSPDVKYNSIVLKGDDSIVAGEVKYEDLPLKVDFLQTHSVKVQSENVGNAVTQVEIVAAYTEEKANILCVSKTGDDREIASFTHPETALDELQLYYPNNTANGILLSPQEFVVVHTEDLTLPKLAISSRHELTSSGDLDHEDSVNFSDVATKRAQADDVVDKVNCSDVATEKVRANCGDVATEKVQADDVVDSVNREDVATEMEQTDNVVDSVHCGGDAATENVQVDVVDSLNCDDVTADKVQADGVVDSVNCGDVATVRADGVVASTDLADKTITVTEVISKNFNHLSGEEHASKDKLPAGTFETDDGFACEADPATTYDVSEVVYKSLVGLSSMPVNILSSDLNQKGFKDTSEHCAEPVIENKVNQLEVAPAAFTRKREFISDHSDSGMIDGNHNLLMPLYAQGGSFIVHESISTKSLDPGNQESESRSNCSHQSDLKEGIESTSPPSLSFSSTIETLSSSDLQAKHKKVELFQPDVNGSNSSNLQQSTSGPLDEEKLAHVWPPGLIQQDQNSNCNKETVQSEFPSSELSVQYPLGELNTTDRTMDPLTPVLPCFSLLPDVPQVDLNEMPPLPPLPPMQWRLGKGQQVSLAPTGSQDRHPSVLPFKVDKKPIAFELSNAEFLQPEAGEDDNSTHLSGHIVHNSVQPPPFSFQFSKISNYNDQSGSAAVDGKQSADPFLTLPNEKSAHDSITSTGEEMQSGSTLLSPGFEDTAYANNNGSLCGPSYQCLSNSSSETSLKLDPSQSVSQDFEGRQSNPHVMIAPLPFTKDEQSRPDLPTSEQEVASCSSTSIMLSTSEVGKPNGNPTSKLLRPRSPLIDAVAAHDKSKLRKVSDRVLPQIGPKVDERDSLLTQIRTKSFNLKPAVATRPSVQGPKTNLRVAAILEKANAIRQAFAGSDEDYDSDSWSDSE